MENKLSDSKGVDLFEDYDNIPKNLQRVLEKHEKSFEDGDYKGLQKALKDVNKLGYTFEYYLDGQAYDLRKIGEKGKSENEQYGKGGGVGSYGVNYNIVFEKPDSDMAWKETINASSEKEARAEFKKKHPTCTILNIFEAYANGGTATGFCYSIGGL